MLKATPSGQIIGCVGPKGSGKTFLALHLAKSARRVIRFDLNRQSDMEAGAVIAESRAELVELVLSSDKRKRMVICYRAHERDPLGFEFGNEMAINLGGCVALWDEAETLMRGRVVPEKADEIIRRGRHAKVDLIWTSQRPTNVIPDVRANSDLIYIFKGFDPTYRNWVESVAGRDLYEALENAPQYTPLVIERGKKPYIGKKI